MDYIRIAYTKEITKQIGKEKFKLNHAKDDLEHIHPDTVNSIESLEKYIEKINKKITVLEDMLDSSSNYDKLKLLEMICSEAIFYQVEKGVLSIEENEYLERNGH
ncbi:hypothetical protein NC796_07525 [Aliifodinibius sp. S!AR15-10]|uniref:hypothetical protein n=1 Tax=Aliifodinibius sp. S!AR15-10 TaxID=2950437 RepID=UPI00285C40D3|nr:hypothetical protein [Aliifodinibius sp. S!AR15-10]MDR8390982.1 hypothetical protein [Aliifodinibius sp. S!AR15-10]